MRPKNHPGMIHHPGSIWKRHKGHMQHRQIGKYNKKYDHRQQHQIQNPISFPIPCYRPSCKFTQSLFLRAFHTLTLPFFRSLSLPYLSCCVVSSSSSVTAKKQKKRTGLCVDCKIPIFRWTIPVMDSHIVCFGSKIELSYKNFLNICRSGDQRRPYYGVKAHPKMSLHTITIQMISALSRHSRPLISSSKTSLFSNSFLF